MNNFEGSRRRRIREFLWLNVRGVCLCVRLMCWDECCRLLETGMDSTHSGGELSGMKRATVHPEAVFDIPKNTPVYVANHHHNSSMGCFLFVPLINKDFLSPRFVLSSPKESTYQHSMLQKGI